jgi:hypothetical protein
VFKQLCWLKVHITYKRTRTCLDCHLSETGVSVRDRLQSRNISESQKLMYDLPSQLLPLASYEIRVSYPATTPLSISLSFDAESEPTSRKLLNAEKLMFRTDEKGLIKVRAKHCVVNVNPVQGYSNAKRVIMTASYVGKANSGVMVEAEVAEFDIVLERLLHDVPWPVLKLFLLLVLCGLLIVIGWHEVFDIGRDDRRGDKSV